MIKYRIYITYFTGAIYFSVIAFYVLFVTKEDFNNSIFGIRLITLFFIFFVSILFGMFFVVLADNGLSSLERRILEGGGNLDGGGALKTALIKFLENEKNSKALFLFLKLFNRLLLIYSFILGIILLGEIPWFVKKILLSSRSWFYPISLFLTVLILIRLRDVIKEIKSKGSEKK